MANEEHLEILRKGVKEWNRWREVNPEVRPDLREADLNGARLVDAYLASADLGGAHLADADLEGADFAGADFTSADLVGAHLFIASLSDANLSGANLFGAELVNANLSGANLFGAALVDARLSSANLLGADLASAKLAYTVFAHVDLRQVKGLEFIHHQGPSSIDTHTFERSRGQIPPEFLRGCGLSDWEIEAVKLWNPDQDKGTLLYELDEYFKDGGPIQFYSAFISYSHDDKLFARALHDELQGRGVRCWRDEKQMLPGDDIYDSVDRGIRVWDKVLLICSKNSLTSSWVEDEIDKALEKERKLRKERGEKVHAIIPLDLDRYLFDGWHDGRASVIRKRLAADFTGWEPGVGFDGEALDRVVRALRADSGGREPEPAPKI